MAPLRARPRRAIPERDIARALGEADLLHEAMLRTLDGSRRWPTGVALPAPLDGIMRSLADAHWRRHGRERALLARESDALAVADPTDPERRHTAVRALATLDRLFADDPVALRVLAGPAGGLSAVEIRVQFGLGEVEYDMARWRMRRLLLRHGLAWSVGWDDRAAGRAGPSCSPPPTRRFKRQNARLTGCVAPQRGRSDACSTSNCRADRGRRSNRPAPSRSSCCRAGAEGASPSG